MANEMTGRVKLQIDAVNNAQKTLTALQGELKALSLPKSMTNGVDKDLSKVTETLMRIQKTANSINWSKINKGDATKLAADFDTARQAIDKLQNSFKNLNTGVGELGLTNSMKSLETQAIKAQEAIQKAMKSGEMPKTGKFRDAFDGLDKAIANIDTTNLKTANQQIEKIREQVQRLKTQSEKSVNLFGGKETQAYKSTQLAIQKVKRELEKAQQEAVKFNEALNKGSISGISNEAAAIEKLQGSFNQLEGVLHRVEGEMKETANAGAQLGAVQGEVDGLLNSFFSVYSIINLLRQGINQTIDAIKDLDSAMTEQAVVTDFNIADLWDQMPKYTKAANELGLAISDMYRATTLYTQQGLDANTSFEVGVETMKMAKIAGLEAAAATDTMTAA